MKTRYVVAILAIVVLIGAVAAYVFFSQPSTSNPNASEESTSITYAGLTALTGEPNPYPAPPVTERYYNPGHVLNPVPTPTDFTTMQAHSSSYYIITDLTIGDDHFTGVSCNVQNAELNFKTHNMNIQYDAIWYIDELGDLPQPKIHCSVLAADALAEAIFDHLFKTKQEIPAKLQKRHQHNMRTMAAFEEI